MQVAQGQADPGTNCSSACRTPTGQTAPPKFGAQAASERDGRDGHDVGRVEISLPSDMLPILPQWRREAGRQEGPQPHPHGGTPPSPARLSWGETQALGTCQVQGVGWGVSTGSPRCGRCGRGPHTTGSVDIASPPNLRGIAETAPVGAGTPAQIKWEFHSVHLRVTAGCPFSSLSHVTWPCATARLQPGFAGLCAGGFSQCLLFGEEQGRPCTPSSSAIGILSAEPLTTV